MTTHRTFNWLEISARPLWIFWVSWLLGSCLWVSWLTKWSSTCCPNSYGCCECLFKWLCSKWQMNSHQHSVWKRDWSCTAANSRDFPNLTSRFDLEAWRVDQRQAFRKLLLLYSEPRVYCRSQLQLVGGHGASCIPNILLVQMTALALCLLCNWLL